MIDGMKITLFSVFIIYYKTRIIPLDAGSGPEGGGNAPSLSPSAVTAHTKNDFGRGKQRQSESSSRQSPLCSRL